MSKGRTVFLLILFGLLFFTFGYFRNYVFLAVNDRASALYYHSESPPLPGILSIFESYGYNALVNAKWVLTFLFTLLFGILSCVVMYILFHEKQYILITAMFYAALFLISLLFIGIGKVFTPSSQHCFHISRGLAHLEQSPIIAILLFLAIKYYKKTT